MIEEQLENHLHEGEEEHMHTHVLEDGTTVMHSHGEHGHHHSHAQTKAVLNTGKIILQDHIEHCIVDAVEHGDKDAIKELERAIDRFMK